MYLYLWIVFAGLILLTAFPLISPKNRTKWKISQAIIVTCSVILAVFVIEFLQIPPFLPIIFVVIVSFLTDRSTYTKTGLIITGTVVILLGAGAYYLFHDDPDYVENYMEDHPDLASLHVSVDGETVISQQGEEKRPLASVVKTIIAIEFANQVAEGAIDPEEPISLSELDKFYLANTDGGAHPAWLEDMKANNKITNDQVTLHEVAKGMIQYSSNANTDFLLGKLGADSVNRVIETLELEQHDPVYPLVSALLASPYLNDQHDGNLSDRELEEMLLDMTMEEYRELVWEIHEKLNNDEADFFDESPSVSMDLQRIWSDRLPNASAEDYAKVMAAISNNTATIPGGEEILRELMEWPMEVHESNREKYAHLGAKGGSTAFVLNQALYAEDHNGKKVELIIFTEGFSFIEQIKMNQNMNSYMQKVLEEHF
ncbi:D-alanyl-D-alanine carboxypeptidase [Gracilibacillus ureilyticus]|uniref:D-alanyl-D-alanine carboxypeptidase n=1 Tax=Gracilibacillus ureilyticus TaxID=531814 RepID=A0A1H9VV78_9BACI|nr:serine hydrolase [Gracilibacillus ureilyticus]SES25575.1 D-alanyl-D-alanine carboxypeptidase [Gracilibacillus ureilyticus]